MVDSSGDIFIDQYWLNQNSSHKEVYDLEGSLTPYLALEGNKDHLYILKFTSNVLQKLCKALHNV